MIASRSASRVLTAGQPLEGALEDRQQLALAQQMRASSISGWRASAAAIAASATSAACFES